MSDRSRLYNSITLTMVALTASVCTIVAIVGAGAFNKQPAAGADIEPTLIQFPSSTPATIPPMTPRIPGTVRPLPTLAPGPTWTPIPTATLLPGETEDVVAAYAGIPAPTVNEAPLELITNIPNARDVSEVAIEVDLRFKEQWARVEQTMQIRNTSNEAWSEIVFSIPLARLDGAFAIDSASAGSPLEPVSPTLDGIMLHVPLPRAIPPGLLARVTLNYRIGAPGVSFYSSFPDGNNGFSDGVMRLGEWYPALAPYRDREGWGSWVYQPVGDPTAYPATNITLAVKAPSGVRVISGGFYGREGNVWRFRIEGARAMPLFASDRYATVEGSASNIPVRVHTLGENPDAANGAIKDARDIIGVYSDMYGPYPFSSLDIVENGYSGDMEYSGLVSISNRGFRTFGGDLPEVMHILLAHEIAHQWWYGGVGNDQVREPWLDESLASYSEVLYYDRIFGYDPNPRMTSFRARDLGSPIDLGLYQYPTTIQYKEAVYPRGAIFLDELRHTVGDAAFFAFLKDYQSQYRGKMATTADFFRVLRAHSSADLTPLLVAYFADPNR